MRGSGNRAPTAVAGTPGLPLGFTSFRLTPSTSSAGTRLAKLKIHPARPTDEEDTMKRWLVRAMIVAIAALPGLATAETACPPEVQEASAMLERLTAASGQPTVSKSLAGRKEAQTARGQDAQTARGQDAQTARGQDAQTARGQDAQTARGQDAQTARSVAKAKALVGQAEAACKRGDADTARKHARSAIQLMKQVEAKK
jgi:hypothetical protein